ncbi:MAG: hypothetical protein L3V56_04090 [Candidatus Magnetoovum sp. WYHC-5]|nr:hypothetical protein [Candidatus Magnetoovum sp. WYHC-5]
MKKDKTEISDAMSYEERGDFWGAHDLYDFWDKTEEVFFDVKISSEVTYCVVGK